MLLHMSRNTPTYENSKARFDYFVRDTLECGIVLTGSEVKTVRSGAGVSLVDSYAHVEGRSVVSNIRVGTSSRHVLLVTAAQARKLAETLKKPGWTAVPLKMYFVHGLVKVLLGVCEGKKTYDKRETIRARDDRRTMEQALKTH